MAFEPSNNNSLWSNLTPEEQTTPEVESVSGNVQNLFSGPFTFAGAYVTSMSISLGWGGDTSSCQMTLVEDPENNMFFTKPKVGTCMGINIGQAEFIGIFQRWTKNQSTSGTTYDVVLESPSKIMSGVSVILDGFQGTGYTGTNIAAPYNEPVFTTQMSNVWNPFAIRENYQYGGIFGGANTNSAGFPVADLVNLLGQISQGQHSFGGPILYGESSFTVDLSEMLPYVALISHYRVSGSVMSLHDIISDISDASVSNFMYSITGFIDPSTNVVEEPAISVKMTDTSVQPDLNTIRGIVETEKASGKLISADNGEELADHVTQKMVIGAPATRWWQTDNVVPVWGRNKVGQWIGGDGFRMSDIAYIIESDGNIRETEVLEIRCAASGREAWNMYHAIRKAWFGNSAVEAYTGMNTDVLQRLVDGLANSNDVEQTDLTAAEKYRKAGVDNIKAQHDKLFDAAKNVADNFWGKQYLVYLPAEPGGVSNNLKFVSEDIDFVSSWEIADSAWLNNANQYVGDISFFDSVGRLRAGVVYPFSNEVDYSSIGTGYTSAFGGIFTKEVQVENEIFWGNLPGQNSAVALTHFTAPAVFKYDRYTQMDGLAALIELITGKEFDAAANNGNMFGLDNNQFYLAPMAVKPSSVGIPQESKRYSWGPWYAFNDRTGKTQVEIDTNLAPENFGTYSLLNEAGFSSVITATANNATVEAGSITLAELPRLSLADRFEDAGPYLTSMNISVGDGGVNTQYSFNTYTVEFGKIAKYNRDRISRIRKNTIEQLQKQRELIRKPALPKYEPHRLPSRTKANSDLKFAGFGAMSGFFGNMHLNAHKPRPHVIGQPAANAAINSSKNYDQAHGQSMEQFMTPITIHKELPDDNAAEALQQARQDEPPMFLKPTDEAGHNDSLFLEGHTSPTSEELNKYFAFGGETDFCLVYRDTAETVTDINQRKGNAPTTEVRPMAQVGPLTLSGWGYDLADQPVPGKRQGDKDNNNKLKFDPENPALDRTDWKTGPVHLMWDDERRVWAGGLQIVEGILDEDLEAPEDPDNPTEATMKLRRGLKNQWGDLDETITLVNRDPSLAVSLDDAEFDLLCIAIRINYEWRPLWVSCTARG